MFVSRRAALCFLGSLYLVTVLHCVRQRLDLASLASHARAAGAGAGPLPPLPGLGPLQVLGEGRYGVAYKARRLDWAGRSVVVKFLKKPAGGLYTQRDFQDIDNATEAKITQFRQECLVAMDLQRYSSDDPEGARRFAKCEEDGVRPLEGKPKDTPLYILQEYVGGTSFATWSLDHLLHDSLTAAIIQNMWDDVRQFLSYMVKPEHEHKWSHNDIHNDNVIVQGERFVFIDFGRATEVAPGARGPPDKDARFAAMLLVRLLTGDMSPGTTLKAKGFSRDAFHRAFADSVFGFRDRFTVRQIKQATDQGEDWLRVVETHFPKRMRVFDALFGTAGNDLLAHLKKFSGPRRKLPAPGTWPSFPSAA